MTDKQSEIMKLISEGNEDGSPVDIDQLCERLTYKPSKEALQFSLRALAKHKMIERTETENRRGRRRRLLTVTKEGNKIFGIKPELGEIPASEELDLDTLLAEISAG